MDVDEVVAREAIRDLGARYAHAADRGHFVDLANLFTGDGVLEITPQEPLVGHAAIVTALTGVGEQFASGQARPLIRHHVSSLAVVLDSPTEARAWSYFLALSAQGPDHWGRYTDRLALDVAGHWRFVHRRVRIDGTAPGSWAQGR